MSYCEDCGCILNDGICSNCHEELYILENQGEFIDFPLSDEFIQKSEEQKKVVDNFNKVRNARKRFNEEE